MRAITVEVEVSHQNSVELEKIEREAGTQLLKLCKGILLSLQYFLNLAVNKCVYTVFGRRDL